MRSIVAATESDNPFAIDIGRWYGQREDISDLISLKNFANAEFCPRFITGGSHVPGYGLEGRHVIIVSTSSSILDRNALAMRVLLTARAAKDNGAAQVTLMQPDLFYSAQDRGPRPVHGSVPFPRNEEDYAKFDGQPFSSRLFCDMMHLSGIDAVVTVHNHSISVELEYRRRLEGRFYNLVPSNIFAHYARATDFADTSDGGSNLVLCAPDQGASSFASAVRDALDLPNVKTLSLVKVRRGERNVEARLSPHSEVQFKHLEGKDVLIVDDMVRTGQTIMECCEAIRQGKPRRVVFAVTHFYSSEESRACLNNNILDEIVTTNTIPQILNRDMQGRLRKKLVVLKIEKWIAGFLRDLEKESNADLGEVLYTVDMSSKNPRWKG